MLVLVDLKKEHCTVDYAIAQVEIEIERCKFAGIKAIKVLHGYGSHGKGGVILIELRKILLYWKKQGIIKDFFGGDKWNLSNPLAIKILNEDKTIYNDEDFNKNNPGITIIYIE